jgi:DNA adenine methylase
MKIKSPLRYPGGKTRAIKYIEPLVPKYLEYREPFVGGGSVFTHLKQKYHANKYWINDLNYDLYLFWKYAKDENRRLVTEVRSIKEEWTDGRKLFDYYKGNWNEFSDFDRAVRFFVLNRITFSGTIDSGGYSKQSFERRFTESSIDRLAKLDILLKNTRITNLDYEKVVKEPGEKVFIFLDPPYYSTTASRLYGKNGDLHTSFDHKRFSNVMKKCNHKWLITYDDCNEIRNLFSFAEIIPWSLQYGMNNYGQDSAGKGKELFITNYEMTEEDTFQLKLLIENQR